MHLTYPQRSLKVHKYSRSQIFCLKKQNNGTTNTTYFKFFDMKLWFIWFCHSWHFLMKHNSSLHNIFKLPLLNYIWHGNFVLVLGQPVHQIVGGNTKIQFPVKKRSNKQRTIYQCDKCQKQFDLKRNFMHHINSHLGIKPYHCDLCAKTFTQKSHLNTHMKIHSGAKPYICHKCGKAFAVNSNFKKHTNIHCREIEEVSKGCKNIIIYDSG